MVTADRGQTPAGMVSGPGRYAAWPVNLGEHNVGNKNITAETWKS